jgi:thiamine transporter ThiT
MILTTYVIPIVLSFMAALLGLTTAISKNSFSTYQIVEMAMLVGIAIVLDLPGLKIRIGASGGSIGFTMVPLFILVLRQGPIKGFVGPGMVYGFATCILDGWGLVTYPFDLPTGLWLIGVIRYFSALLSSTKKSRSSIYRGMLFLCLGVLIAIAGGLLASTLSASH